MFGTEELTETEKTVFETEYWDFVHSNYPEKTHELLRDSRAVIIEAIERTKYEYQSNFNGIFPTAGYFGWSFPHPMFFFTNKDTWINQYKKGSWTIWIDKVLHSSGSTFLLLGFYEPSNTPTCKISSVYVDSDGITYPPLWIKNILNESRIYILPKPIFSTSMLKIKTLSESDGVCELIPLGIYFGSRLHEISCRQPQVKAEKRA